MYQARYLQTMLGSAGAPAPITSGALLAMHLSLAATGSGVISPQLPAPGPEFPVEQIDVVGVRQSDPAESGVLVAEPAERIEDRLVQVLWNHLNELERNQLIDVWDGGRGAVREFTFTVPGEGAPDFFIFEEPRLDVARLKADRSSAVLRLRRTRTTRTS